MRKEKGADQDIGLEYLTQNWHFLTFPEPFLAARGHSLRNPGAFRSSVPAYNPMGASRIVSAKKHSGKVSKCSDLLYAFQTNVLVRPLLFPRSHSLIQSWFSQHVGTLGLWHAGRYWRQTTDVSQLILRPGFVFCSVIGKGVNFHFLLRINRRNILRCIQ